MTLITVPLSESELWLLDQFAVENKMTPENAAAEIIAATVELHAQRKKGEQHGRH